MNKDDRPACPRPNKSHHAHEKKYIIATLVRLSIFVQDSSQEKARLRAYRLTPNCGRCTRNDYFRYISAALQLSSPSFQTLLYGTSLGPTDRRPNSIKIATLQTPSDRSPLPLQYPHYASRSSTSAPPTSFTTQRLSVTNFIPKLLPREPTIFATKSITVRVR